MGRYVSITEKSDGRACLLTCDALVVHRMINLSLTVCAPILPWQFKRSFMLPECSPEMHT